MTGTPGEALYWAADTARYAPSVHNMQPWRWVVRGDRLELFTVIERQLHEQNPDGRHAAQLRHRPAPRPHRPGARLHILNRDQVLKLAVMIEHAGDAEQHDGKMRAETAVWVGGDRPDTGLPDAFQEAGGRSYPTSREM
ncbi:nitroreductase family protein [Dactylosporangium sp. CS-047395]|uniref:nitroreductase family protein n=1 Tax=Dactylosporangium sp. CS-047395 TaxID=3239936 RepID=UPI003D922938